MSIRNIISTDDNVSNSTKSKDSMKEKIKLKELFNRDLNKSIVKLCSDADLRIKVLLSNTVNSGETSSSSKFSLKETFSALESTTKHSSLGTKSKSISLRTTKHSSKNILKHKSCSGREIVSDSLHFNTEIDNNDDPINKQLTVVKILKLQELARKMEERQNTVIKNKFESAAFQKSYVNGVEEGFRYGYFDNPNIGLKTHSVSSKTGDSTYNDYDKVIFKNTEERLLETKESGRMRAGFQNAQQHEIKKKNDPNISPSGQSLSKIEVSKFLNELKSYKLAIKHEYPTKCVEDINIQAFNQKYKISDDNEGNEKSKSNQIKTEVGLSTKELSEIDKGGQYLQYFEKMLNSVGEEFAKGFRAGFGDGFVAANIFTSGDTTFSDDEREYISEMRKILKFSEDDLNNDMKKMNARAAEMKKHLNIPTDEFKDISFLIKKGVAKNIPLKFSKNDYKYYTYATKRDRGNIKIKSSYEEDSDIAFTFFEGERGFVPQRTKNRAIRYLTSHRINEFFQFLGSHLVATKPDDPISFLINLLNKCIEYRFNEFVIPPPLLFTKKHVESVYFVLDPMVTGYIDLTQYAHGMEALGITDLSDLSNFRPGEKIDKYIFITNACRRLLSKFREMIAIDAITAFSSKATYTNVEAN